MIKYLLITAFVVFTIFDGLSQNNRFDEVKNSGKYLYGYGESEDYEMADKNALDNLISQISVNIESTFINRSTEKNDELSNNIESVVKTYSNVTLSDAGIQEYEKKGIFHILRFIKKEDINKVFENRRRKITNYLGMGTNAQREYRTGDALRYYYWAYALLESHPEKETMVIKVDGKPVLVEVLLYDRLNSVFSDIHFEIINKTVHPGKKNTELSLKCTFKGYPVKNLDFKSNYAGFVNPLQEVNEGRSAIYLYEQEQKNVDMVTIRIEYKYIYKSSHDKELYSVLKNIQLPYFKKAAKQLRIKNDDATVNKPGKPEFKDINVTKYLSKDYRKTVLNIMDDISSKNYKNAYQYFNSEGLQMFKDLVEYGEASILPFKDTLSVINLSGEVMVRSIPMSFYFPSGKRRFVENVVFLFNEEKKIEAVSFSVSDKTIYDIVSHSSSFGSLLDKYTLIKFMEFYKTAYSLKRYDYVKSIFSENALIIVGTVLKKSQKPIEGMYKSLGEHEIRYQQLTKKEYMERLKMVFESNEFINIDFEGAEVRKKNGNDKIYGIQITQNYYSSTYNDFGYLFLVIDMTDTLNPTILVRTWQPEKDKEGNIYGINDFKMN
jgi:hypothetical protein